MDNLIRSEIIDAINNNNWIEVVYKKDIGSKETYFNIGIENIDLKNKKLDVRIFNQYKSLEVVNNIACICFDKITKATRLEGTYFKTNKNVIDVVNSIEPNWLNKGYFNFQVIKYFKKCYKYDNDPSIDKIIKFEGINCEDLLNNKEIKLNDVQFKNFISIVEEINGYRVKNCNFYSLCLSDYSIVKKDKIYPVVYYEATLNFLDKSLHIESDRLVNSSFGIEGRTVSLNNYIEGINIDDFKILFNKQRVEVIESIEKNFDINDRSNTKPFFYLQKREPNQCVFDALDSIAQGYYNSELSLPLKSYFGFHYVSKTNELTPNLFVTNNKQLNSNQANVLYRSLKDDVLYIQGPPGTGKTNTIFNVVINLFLNNQTCLICSNNNKPISDIFNKMNKVVFKKTEIMLPIIRIGSSNVMISAIERMKDIQKFLKENRSYKFDVKKLNKSIKVISKSYDNLICAVNNHIKEQNINEEVALLNKNLYIVDNTNIQNKIKTKINLLTKSKSKLNSTNIDFEIQHSISCFENEDFIEFLTYKSYSHLQNLFKKENSYLIKIINMKDMNKAVYELNQYLNNKCNLLRFLEIFPIVLGTNLSCGNLGPDRPTFSCVIMDEAGQCNEVSSLVSIVRGKRLILCGDTKQLKPVCVLEEAINNRLMKEYNIDKTFNYLNNSVLSSMLYRDTFSKNIMLEHHYRCAKKIANFANVRFYGGQLKLDNKEEGVLKYLEVHNVSSNNLDVNANIDEAKTIVDYIKTNNLKDVGIVTPYVAQAKLINSELKKVSIDNVKAGTIHTLQGSEKDTIIFSSSISKRTREGGMKWINDNYQLINVCETRAKKSFIFVGDREMINARTKEKDKSDLYNLSEYVASNGKTIVVPSEKVILSNFSNDSINEKEFFDTLSYYFGARKNKFLLSRNVNVLNVLTNIDENDKKICEKYEYDFVIYIKKLFIVKPIMVLELDGPEHVYDKETMIRDRKKEEITNKYGLKLIRFPNSLCYNYRLIFNTLKFQFKGKGDYFVDVISQ